LTAIRLVTPSVEHLPAYIAALESGWSPNTTRDVCAEQLTAIAADPAAFLRQFMPEATGTVKLGDGTEVPRLPGATYWIFDTAFCGAINHRRMPGTEELPPHVSGHIGYAVIPAKRGRGVAKAALRLLLPMLHELGLPRALLTCDETNIASRRVIEANGGVFDGFDAAPEHTANPGQAASDGPDVRKLRFWVPTSPAAADVDRPPA
jgi:predicted acetyltransferase